MMRMLLDTCLVYDWMMGRIRDSNIIQWVEAEGACVSAVSILEMSIKHSLGKLSLPSKTPVKDVEEQGFTWLNVTPLHAERVLDMEHHHKDPFDRLIIAQAIHESMHILTYDTIFQKYPCRVSIVRK